MGSGFGKQVMDDMLGFNPPPQPNYAGAAEATAAGNLENAKLQQVANMVNQYTPYGAVTYKPIGKVDGFTQWGQYVDMSPEQKKLFDQSNRINQELGDISETGINFVQDALNKPLNFNNMQALGSPEQFNQKAADSAYNLAMSYAEPRMARDQAALENQLSNQGIQRGSEAWDNAMTDLSENENKFYADAENRAYLSGLQGANQMYNQALGNRQQQIQEAQTLQQNPLNILNAVRTGQQLSAGQGPQVSTSSPAQMRYVEGPDYNSAALNQYEADSDFWDWREQKNQMYRQGAGGFLGGLFGK